jgi:hypothetical protein
MANKKENPSKLLCDPEQVVFDAVEFLGKQNVCGRFIEHRAQQLVERCGDRG